MAGFQKWTYVVDMQQESCVTKHESTASAFVFLRIDRHLVLGLKSEARSYVHHSSSLRW